MKKAQFNWIFILIAGFIILALFVAFIVDYRNLSFRKMNTQLAVEVDSQLDLLSIEKLSAKINPTGMDQFKTEFFCNYFSINGGDQIYIRDKIIFSPSSIETSELLLWVDEFYFPYKVADLIYISSPNIKYYLYPKEKVEEFLEYLPKKFNSNNQLFNIEAIDYISEEKIKQDISRERLKEIKFVLFENTKIPRFNIKTKILNVNLIDGIEKGKIGSSYFIKKQLLLGAIFSDNYNCFLDKITNKVSLLNQVYKEKATKLHIKNNNPECNYQTITSYLKKSVDLEELYDNQERIFQKNKEFFMKGCSDVF
ncbi:hypothetical protein CL621_01695 [archaeon]|nr:hypothetical protein [archaeon]|tara:strand:- start:235 stop:1164 length:930 start_codon:yes stop_codon:yes gene_type:complete